MKFDGKYFNGEKITGKEYDINGNLILTLDNNEGKEFYDNSKIKFNGKYRNGKRWNGKGYNYKGEECFQIQNGNGKVIEYDYYGKLRFIGEYKNGEKNGKGE